MSALRILAACAILAAVGGCASDSPAGDGSAVRALMASQVIPPTPQRGAGGTDAAVTGAALANYRQSFVAPPSQGDATIIGKK